MSNGSVTGAFMKTKVHLRLLPVLNLSIASHSRKAKGKGVAAFVVRQDATSPESYATPASNSAGARLRPMSIPVSSDSMGSSDGNGATISSTRSSSASTTGECVPCRVTSSMSVETEKTSGRMALKSAAEGH